MKDASSPALKVEGIKPKQVKDLTKVDKPVWAQSTANRAEPRHARLRIDMGRPAVASCRTKRLGPMRIAPQTEIGNPGWAEFLEKISESVFVQSIGKNGDPSHA